MDIPYFMDHCQYWEINDIIEYLPYLDRNLWETSRLNAYVVAQVNNRKQLKMQDICTFKWEETTGNIEISNEDIERLKAKAKKYEYNGHNSN